MGYYQRYAVKAVQTEKKSCKHVPVCFTMCPDLKNKRKCVETVMEAINRIKINNKVFKETAKEKSQIQMENTQGVWILYSVDFEFFNC